MLSFLYLFGDYSFYYVLPPIYYYDYYYNYAFELVLTILSIFILTKSSMGVFNFISFIISYFSALVFAFTPYHGNPPFMKYIKTNPKHSKSSLLLCSTPICVFKLAYRAVPVKLFPSLYGIC